jgi:hypothetical protein
MPAQYPRGRAPCVVAGMDRRRRQGPGRFRSPRFFGRFSISGVTRDGAGATLGNCTVHLFDSATDTELDETISDASGNYAFSLGTNCGFYYLVAYKPGAPDVSGVSINTITAA